MKKLIMGLAAIATLAGCKKISAGGNDGRLKMEENEVRYSDDAQGAVIQPDTMSSAAHSTPAKPVDSAAAKNPAAKATEKTETAAKPLSAPVGNAPSNPQ